MKYLKLFEDFITDQTRGQDPTFDHSMNPVIRLKAKEYVESVLHSNQYKKIFDELGVEMPKNVSGDDFDAMFDQIGEKAINYFSKNPHKMTIESDDMEIKKSDVDLGTTGSERIPITNNIGGALNAQTVPGGPV